MAPSSPLPSARSVLRKTAYKAILKSLGAEEDAVKEILRPEWHWKRTECGGWLSPGGTIQGIKTAIRSLPWCKGHPARMAQAENADPLAGFVPVRPVDILLRPDAVPKDVRPLIRRPDIKWAESTVDPKDAWAALGEQFPGINETYVKALIGGAACAEPGGNMQGLLVTGVTGSAKTATAHIVAGFMGGTHASIRLQSESEAFRRQIGEALSHGDRILLIDEVDKLYQFKGNHVPKILSLQEVHRYRPLFGVDVAARWRSTLVCTAVSIPEAFRAPEMGRRFRHLRLNAPVGPWSLSDPRKYPQVVDSVIRDCVDLAGSVGFSWASLCDVLGLRNTDELDEGEDTLYSDFYEYVTAADAPLSPHTKYNGASGWVDLMTERGHKVTEPLMVDVGPRRDPKFATGRDLEAYNWSKIVGKHVECQVRKHGFGIWVARFLDGVRVVRGQSGRSLDS